MAIHTIIGVKRLAIAKQRLAPHLSPAERRRLMLRMLESVVAAAHSADLGPVSLATSDPAAGGLAVALHVDILSDGDLAWNDGLVHALASLAEQPARVLYLAGDLPLLRAADLRELAAEAPPRGVAIARARDAGTNALLVSPSGALHPSFGARRSSEVHEAAARASGLAARVLDIPGLALDVDTIDDARDAGVLTRPPVSGRGRGRGDG